MSELINHCRGGLHQAVLHSPPPCIYPHVFNETWSFHQLISKLFGSSCPSRITDSVSKLLLSIQNYLQCFQALTVSVNPKVCASVSKLLLSIQNYERLFQALTVNPELHAMYQSHTVNPELHAVFQSDSVLVSIQDDVQCFKVLIQLLSIQKYHVQCFKVLIFNPKLCAVFQSSYCQTRIMSSVSKFFFVKPELCASFQSSYCSSSIMHYVLKVLLVNPEITCEDNLSVFLLRESEVP